MEGDKAIRIKRIGLDRIQPPAEYCENVKTEMKGKEILMVNGNGGYYV